MGGGFRRFRSWIGLVAAVAIITSGCGKEAPPLSVDADDSGAASTSAGNGAANGSGGNNSAGANSPAPSSTSSSYGPAASYGPAESTSGSSRYSSGGQATAAPSRYSDSGNNIAASEPTAGAYYPSLEKKQVRIKITTSLGPISIGLFPDKAPITVDNFLRNYVDRQFYDNTIVHYADSGIVAAGGYSDRYQEKTGSHPIRNEANNGLKNVRGTIAMGRAFDQIDSATSQFFFNVTDNKDFDHAGSTAEDYGYCVFGKVIEGMQIVDRMAAAPTHDAHGMTSVPKQAIIIKSIEVLR